MATTCRFKLLLRVVGLIVALVCIIAVLASSDADYWNWYWRKTNAASSIEPTNIMPPTASPLATALLTTPKADWEVLLNVESEVLQRPFSMPCPGVFLPPEKLVKSEWMVTLLRFLSGLKSKQLNLVTGNNQYQEVLLNWLIISANVKPPMKDILVLALDKDLYDVLHTRQIPCVFIEPTAMVTGRGGLKMVRIGLLRILNWLGFDVAFFDADALILKNPQPLFDKFKTDIVSSNAIYPPELKKKWHFTLCIGVILVRSSKRTEEYWNVFSQHGNFNKTMCASDQVRINYGLHELKVRWNSKQGYDKKSIVGICRNNLTVTAIPRRLICRPNCNPRQINQYYIWHNLGSGHKNFSKVEDAKHIHRWFLRKDWRTISDRVNATGQDWLKLITRGGTHDAT